MLMEHFLLSVSDILFCPLFQVLFFFFPFSFSSVCLLLVDIESWIPIKDTDSSFFQVQTGLLASSAGKFGS